MRKVLMVILLAGIPFCWQPLRGQAPGVGVKSSQNTKQQPTLRTDNADKDQRGTYATPLIVETHNRPDSAEEAAQHRTENEIKEYRDSWTFRLTIIQSVFAGLVVVFTGFLVVVGWNGVKAALRTLLAIERQAGLMERQIQLQEAALIPWADIRNWQVEVFQLAGPLSLYPTAVAIFFDLVNDSGFPFTTAGELRFFGKLPNAVTCILPGNAILLPKRPLKIRVNLYLSNEQAAEYTDKELLRIAVHGELSHVGVSGRRSFLMEIHGNLVCGRNRPTELEYEAFLIGQNAQQPQAEGQNPNLLS